MGSKGIRDQVAVIGMGCTRFGELWDKGVDDLLTDATTEAVASELSIGDRVSMTFRRVWTAQGVHNYFWKARPAVERAGGGADIIEKQGA